MEEFEKKEILNPFLKWFGALLICPIALLTAVCGDWIWAVEFAGMGVIFILFSISRLLEKVESKNLMPHLFRCLAAVFAILSMIELSIDIFMWHRAFLALAIATGLLILSFRKKR